MKKKKLEDKFIYFIKNLKKLNSNKTINRKIIKDSVLISNKKYISRIKKILS